MKPSTDIRHRAMNLLARREHSCFELRRKLVSRGVEGEAIDAVLRVLVEEGLLSDTRFAVDYITMRVQRGYGPMRIEQELQARGVESDLVQQSLAEVNPDWVAQAGAVREKKFGVALPKDFETRAKQIHFLQYRGFDGAEIKTLFDAAVGMSYED